MACSEPLAYTVIFTINFNSPAVKSTYLLIVAVVACCLSACKKDSHKGPITGKWYENKLEIHLSNGTLAAHDTTFTAASFTTDDYFEFNSNGTALFSQSGVYGITGKSEAISGNTTVIGMAHYNYSIVDGQLKLIPTDLYPTTANLTPGYQLEDIVQLDANHLVLRTTVSNGAPFSLITTMYFTKGK